MRPTTEIVNAVKMTIYCGNSLSRTDQTCCAGWRDIAIMWGGFSIRRPLVRSALGDIFRFNAKNGLVPVGIGVYVTRDHAGGCSSLCSFMACTELFKVQLSENDLQIHFGLGKSLATTSLVLWGSCAMQDALHRRQRLGFIRLALS
jgi:hypothetical protein